MQHQESIVRKGDLLLDAAKNGDVSTLQDTIRAGADASTQDSTTGNSALHLAAENGHLLAIQLLLNARVSMCCENKRLATPLHLASRSGQTDAVQYLVDRGADVSRKNIRGSTPLHLAAENGHALAMKVLLVAGAEVSVVGDREAIPLHAAAQNGHVESIQVLIDWNADVSRRDQHGWTPLHLAAHGGHKGAVCALLESKPDIVNAEGEGKFTPLHLAAQNGNLDVVNTLTEAGAKLVHASWNVTPTHLAAEKRHDEVLQALSARLSPRDLSFVDEFGYSPLHSAVRIGHTASINVLLEAGADVDAKDNHGWSPCHLAAQNGHEEAIRLLFNTGANVSSRNGEHFTPLHVAAFKGHATVIRTLIEHCNVDVDCLLDDHLTALHLASQNDHADAANALIDCNAQLSSRDSGGLTPLHVAARSGNACVVRCLVEAGADVDARDDRNFTAMHLAARRGHADVLRILASVAHWQETDPSSLLPIDIATICGHFDAVKVLLEKPNFDVPATTNLLPTTIDWAIIRHETEILKLLIQHVPPEVLFTPNHDQWIPLQLAVYHNNTEAVVVLAERMNAMRTRCHSSSAYLPVRYDDTTSWNCKCVALALGRSERTIQKITDALGDLSTIALLQWHDSMRCSPAQDVLLSSTNLEEWKALGEGGCGVVCGVTLENGDQRALKRDIDENAAMSTAFETAILSALDHPNIIKVFGLVQGGYPTQDFEYMVMEWMNEGNLIDWMKKQLFCGNSAALEEPTLRQLMKQCLEALKYLHEPIHTDPFGRPVMAIVHHDIKPQNMLIHTQDGTPVLKVADFGVSRFDRYHSVAQHLFVAGTPGYLSPEAQAPKDQRSKLQYTPASDMYSWAKTFLQVAALRFFRSSSPSPEAVKMMFEHARLTKQAKRLIRRCLDTNPEKRFSAQELLEDDYFSNDELFSSWLQEHDQTRNNNDVHGTNLLDKISTHLSHTPTTRVHMIQTSCGGGSTTSASQSTTLVTFGPDFTFS